MRVLRKRRDRRSEYRPEYGTPEFARWLNGRVTKFCGHGYHEGGEGLACKGTISTAGIECPCLCECHDDREPVG